MARTFSFSTCKTAIRTLDLFETFLTCNSLNHAYFAFKQLVEALQPGSLYLALCPQCQNGSFSVGKIRLGAGLADGYAPLLDGENEPRGSTERPVGGEGEGESMV